LISISPQNTDVGCVSTSQVSIVNTMTENFAVCHTLAIGSCQSHKCYIILTSLIQQFDVRKGHVHRHKTVTKFHTTHEARAISNARMLARIPDETGPFALIG